MHRYYCYGLHIKSEIEIPELVSSEHPRTDIEIRYGNVEAPATEDSSPGSFTVQSASDSTTVWIEQVGGIEARQGRELIISPRKEADEKGFRFLISGVGLALILHQRDIPSLHASAVAIDGKAVAFVGGKGMGKSTTAAAFHNREYPLVTDDVLPFQLKSDSVEVLPAFPNLKLYSDSVEAVFEEDPRNHPRLLSQGDKRTRSAEHGFPKDALPLECVYALEWGEENSSVETSKMSGQEACLKLLGNSFALRTFQEEKATASQLRQFSEFIDRVPVRKLTRPRSLEKVDNIPALIERELGVEPDPVPEF